MKTVKKTLIYFWIISFFSFTTSFAQLTVPFKMRYKGFVKGDMTIIANNIVNRVDYSNNSNDPYYNHTNYAKLNDEFDMEYIDIDDDETTFSSSSAELFYENSNNKKVVYAGLYWSATYKYNAGIQKNETKFIATDPNRDSFNTIKLKLPNQEKYIDILGQTIYDGINEKEINDFAPYAVYADVTNYIKKLQNSSGVYTVANIRATQGFLKGGVAAGWTLFIVYEDETMSGKFITSFDGFAGVTDKTTDIVFSGFEAMPQGNVTAKIACAALEGDNNLIGDQLLFSSSPNKSFITLNNTIRKENNFFNSCITIENQYFTNRFPDSKNTLGYDTCLFTIPNPDNSIIGNNSKESVLRLKSTGDSYFMFFTAYNIAVTPATVKQNEDNLPNLIVSSDGGFSKIVTPKRTIKFVTANNDFLVDDYKTTSTMNRLNKYSTFEKNKNIIEIQTLNSTNISQGYYIIANIFKTEQKAKEFISYLKSKKFEADFFTNTLNNYKYVFLKKTNSQEEAIALLTSKMEDAYNERIQIVAINKDINTLIAESNKKEIIQKTLLKPTANKKEPFEIQLVTIANQPKGYYIVANVFSVNENSTNFVNMLKSKGFDAKLLTNPKNNFKYIYLKKVDNEQEAIALYLSKVNNTYQDKLWILSVNNNSPTLTSNDD